jgi:hypothetical protein
MIGFSHNNFADLTKLPPLHPISKKVKLFLFGYNEK